LEILDELTLEVSKLKIEDEDSIVIKSNHVTMEQLHNLHKHLVSSGLRGVKIIKLNLEDDIQIMNEEDMNRAGWFKLQSN
jgi:hypothetical protein